MLKISLPFYVVMGNPARFEKFNSYFFEQFEITPQDLEIENNHLHSQHPYINKCLKNFNANVRRKILPIDDK